MKENNEIIMIKILGKRINHDKVMAIFQDSTKDVPFV